MSVSVRLTRLGKKYQPSYRIVAVNTRSKRDGKVLDTIGHYNPSQTPALQKIDNQKIDFWRGQGAIFSTAVEKILKGEYVYTLYKVKTPKKVESDDSAPVEEPVKETVDESAKESTEAPSDQPAEKITEEPAEESAEEPAKE